MKISGALSVFSTQFISHWVFGNTDPNHFLHYDERCLWITGTTYSTTTRIEYNWRRKNLYPKSKNKVKEMAEKRQNVCDAEKQRTGPTWTKKACLRTFLISALDEIFVQKAGCGTIPSKIIGSFIGFSICFRLLCCNPYKSHFAVSTYIMQITFSSVH